ncbi:hypothetical protein [Flavisolibacter nicotianae]|uniref:hypothetical protein n=1 Tax=Flavisolibacter nicotianae TaxID=2364882 RepID=UPI0013C44835|nr:hypothetical protein [Flavisolibacter nicotianae]
MIAVEEELLAQAVLLQQGPNNSFLAVLLSVTYPPKPTRIDSRKYTCWFIISVGGCGLEIYQMSC